MVLSWNNVFRRKRWCWPLFRVGRLLCPFRSPKHVVIVQISEVISKVIIVLASVWTVSRRKDSCKCWWVCQNILRRLPPLLGLSPPTSGYTQTSCTRWNFWSAPWHCLLCSVGSTFDHERRRRSDPYENNCEPDCIWCKCHNPWRSLQQCRLSRHPLCVVLQQTYPAKKVWNSLSR